MQNLHCLLAVKEASYHNKYSVWNQNDKSHNMHFEDQVRYVQYTC